MSILIELKCNRMQIHQSQPDFGEVPERIVKAKVNWLWSKPSETTGFYHEKKKKKLSVKHMVSKQHIH